MQKLKNFVHTFNEYWKIGAILCTFLGSVAGSYLAWSADYGHLKYVQEAQAATLKEHTELIQQNEIVLATLPPIKEAVDRIDTRIGRIESYLITKKER